MASAPANRRMGGALAGVPLAGGFVALAAWMWLAPPGFDPQIAEPVMVERSLLAVAPRRSAMTDPASTDLGGFRQSCNGCHQIFTVTGSPPGAGTVPSPALPTAEVDTGQGAARQEWDSDTGRVPAPPALHAGIALRHGLNNRCTNCHDSKDLERLRLHDGKPIPYSQVAMLCAQCHGTVYRDWERGSHGKTLGAWSNDMAEKTRLRCSECHDPHAPAYPKYTPLPGPNTLRMGRQEATHAHDEKHRPLRRLLSPHENGGHP
ncbi:MAG: hypothetical protein FJ255_08055 [Phycisphaerae bacterium]|nr:hypothetical protein [Phycisphaerae bacterium]